MFSLLDWCPIQLNILMPCEYNLQHFHLISGLCFYFIPSMRGFKMTFFSFHPLTFNINPIYIALVIKTQTLKMKDLLHPSQADEKRKHKVCRVLVEMCFAFFFACRTIENPNFLRIYPNFNILFVFIAFFSIFFLSLFSLSLSRARILSLAFFCCSVSFA